MPPTDRLGVIDMALDLEPRVVLAINRIFREALGCETEERLGRVCLSVAEELTGSSFGFVGELNAQGDLDNIAISEPGWAACAMEDRSGHGKAAAEFPVRGVYGRVVRDGQGFFTNTPASHPDSVGTPEGHPAVSAFLGVPLFGDGRLLGLVALANRPGGYRAEDLAATEALAPAIVHALHHWRVERARKDSEERYRSIVETAREGVLIGAPDGRIQFVNEAMAEMLGYARDELLGRAGTELMDTEGQQPVPALRQTLHEGRPIQSELRFRRRDGSVLWTLCSASPLNDGAGRHVANLAMHTDITKRKQAEEARREALERAAWLAQFPQENPSPVVRVSAQGTVLYRNRATLLAPGCACEEGGRLPEPLRALAEEALRGGGTVRDDVLLEDRTYSVTVAPFVETQYANIYISDVSERVAAEREVREARDRLEVRVQERTGELAAANRALETEIVERRRVEQTVRAERQRLYDVLDTLPAYVVLLAPDYQVPFANRFFRERFGESHGRCCFEYLFGRSEPCEVCESYKVLKTGARHRWEWLGPDGRNYDIYDFPFKDADGTPLIMEMGLDITERKQAEAELRRHQEHLEDLVKERTAEIGRRNDQLVAEVAERERAEEALRQAQQEQERYLAQLEAVLDHLTEGLVISDLDGQVFHWNPAALAMHEFASVDEARRRLPEFESLFELSTPEEGVLPVDRWPLARILNGETLHDWEVAVRRRTGDWRRIFRYGGTLARNKAGQPILAVVTVTDVTARKQAEQAVRESREDLNRAQAVAHTGSWRLDVRKNELLWSDETYRMFGIPTGTPLTYEMFQGAVHPEDRELVDQRWANALRGEGYDVEHRIVVGDDVRWVRERAELEVEPDGTLKGGFGTVQDVTERRLAQAALQKAHDTLEQRVEERTAELHRVNRTLRMISDCNQALVRATTEQELVREICRVIHDRGPYKLVWVGYAEDDAEKNVRPVAAVGFREGYLGNARFSWADVPLGRGPTGTCIRTGRLCLGRDFLTDGELLPWRELARSNGFRSSIALPLIAEGRAFGALSLYAEDEVAFGTEQVMLLSELADDLAFGILARRAAIERDHARQVAEERARQLAALATELGRVEQRERQRLAGVLHDHLQQLLVGAKYNLATLAREGRAQAKRQALRSVTHILDDAIAAASSLTAELSPPALHERGLIAGLEWLGRQMRQKHGLKVQVRAHPDAEPAGEQVRFLLFDAARELLFNVVKHAKVDRARVDVERTAGEQVRVVVADSGAGFDPARLERGSGGFGLFSVRERLSCLGGRMSIESQPGRGSRFTLVAPAGAPEKHAAEARTSGAEATAGPGAESRPAAAMRIRVLLADDHAVMREGLGRLLGEEPDIEVIGEASDGLAAVELARRLQPDVILMDVAMPHMNGLDATERLLLEGSEARVIGLSMHEDAEMSGAMRQAGAVEYLSKSGPPKQLLAAIRACMASRPRDVEGATPDGPEQVEAPPPETGPQGRRAPTDRAKKPATPRAAATRRGRRG